MPTVAEQIKDEGRAVGRAEGRAEGRADALLDLLELKFSSVPEERRDQVRAAGMDELVGWNGAILTAESIDDVFARHLSE